MIEIVTKIEEKLAALDASLSDPSLMSDHRKLADLNRQRRVLVDILETGRAYRTATSELNQTQQLVDTETDPDMLAMAKEELVALVELVPRLEAELKVKLLPRDPNDDKASIVEIRAGTGGDEAAIFAGDICRMYQRYADAHRWKLETLSVSPGDMGGFKEIILRVEGESAYGRLKYESGVHRVQRVPATESQGRIHTSAVTVAVFPEAEEVDIDIKEQDLRIDVYRSSGPGGQSVNTTDSAVRVTHIPTGLVVTCQDEKSQLKNKQKALVVLRSRLLDMAITEQQSKQAAERREMVSTGDRSAKIRTYNFPQSRVTDHRINLSLYNLDTVLEGELDLLLEPLMQHDREAKLKAQGEGIL